MMGMDGHQTAMTMVRAADSGNNLAKAANPQQVAWPARATTTLVARLGAGVGVQQQQQAAPKKMQPQQTLLQVQTLKQMYLLLGLSMALAVAQLQQQRAAAQMVGRAAAAVAASASRSHQQTPLWSSLRRTGAPSCTTSTPATSTI
jgi:hypothetical protein